MTEKPSGGALIYPSAEEEPILRIVPFDPSRHEIIPTPGCGDLPQEGAPWIVLTEKGRHAIGKAACHG